MLQVRLYVRKEIKIRMPLSFFRKAFSENMGKRCYYAAYTLCFAATAFLCLSWFIFSGKTLIWETDGWKQHYKAMVYLAVYLRKIIRSLIYEHRLVIPAWDHYIGEGSDVGAGSLEG